jgi:NADPH-dependent curcumin reductase
LQAKAESVSACRLSFTAIAEADPTSPELNRQWLVASAPDTTVGEGNFRLVDSQIPSPADGQALVRNLWFSLDPTNVLGLGGPPEAGGIPVGGVMRGLAVSQVVESRHKNFRRGELVHGYSGWEDYSLTEGHGFYETTKVPSGVSPNLALGTLGVTGMVAYFGVVEVGKPRKGETFVVSGAAGGVGTVAGQIAKILGARVIGTAGGREKCTWLTDKVGFDGAVDYRTSEVPSRFSELCPEGIDVFFDNVGGPILDEALSRLRRDGRIVLCGLTSRYLAKERPPGPKSYGALIMVNGRMQGVLAKDYFDRFPEAISVMRGWLESGELKSMEDIMFGLGNAPAALARLFSGANRGKQLLKIADPVASQEI